MSTECDFIHQRISQSSLNGQNGLSSGVPTISAEINYKGHLKLLPPIGMQTYDENKSEVDTNHLSYPFEQYHQHQSDSFSPKPNVYDAYNFNRKHCLEKTFARNVYQNDMRNMSQEATPEKVYNACKRQLEDGEETHKKRHHTDSHEIAVGEENELQGVEKNNYDCAENKNSIPLLSEVNSSEKYELNTENYYDKDNSENETNNMEINRSPESLPDNNMSIDEYDSQDGNLAAKINTQGKVKLMKCKNCPFVTNTKYDYWDHIRIHIKPEKRLECNQPECNFVTELKHHLEYHKRNHTGDKPFKCDKCSYSCVNKSMLNSHMKSHSNLYQYRCMDCSYATKYCHSLKVHLRKQRHNPSVVLNPDGTPNPVPIIDVYGTRRGPKIKKDDNGMPILPPQYKRQAELLKTQMEFTGTLPPAPQPNRSPTSSFTTTNPVFQSIINQNSGFPDYYNMLMRDFSAEYGNSDPLRMISPSTQYKMSKSNQSMGSCSPAYSPIFPIGMYPNKPDINDKVNISYGDPGITNIKRMEETSPEKATEKESQLPFNMNKNSDQYIEIFRQLLAQRNPMLTYNYGDIWAANQLSAQLINESVSKIVSTEEIKARTDVRNVEVSRSRPETPEAGETSILGTILDLSKDRTSLNVTDQIPTPLQIDSPPYSTVSPPNSDVSTPPTKHRRKGKAFKIDRIALRLSNGETSEKEKETCSDVLNDENLVEIEKNIDYNKGHKCKHCEISFIDYGLYSFHVGFHGYIHPYDCNRCGQETKDATTFAMHVARMHHD